MTMTATQPQNGAGAGQAQRPPPRDPTIEILAGGTPPWVAAYVAWARALPTAVDDAEAQFGTDLYRIMLRDPQVSASVRTVLLSMLAQEVTLTPAAVEKSKVQSPKSKEGAAEPAPEPGEALADELHGFFDYGLTHLRESLVDVLFDCGRKAMTEGHGLAEVLYREAEPEERERFPGLPEGGWVLDALKPKDRLTYSLVVDRGFNLLGVLPRPQGLWLGATGALSVNVEDLVPPEHFLLVTWQKTDGDPRGRSGLREVYDAWWRKQQVIADYLKYLAQFATPSLAVILGELAFQYRLPVVDAAGNPMFDATGAPQLGDPYALAYAAIIQFQGGSGSVWPPGTTLQPVQMQGNGEAHLKALEDCDHAIEHAITLQGLATSEAQFGTRAQAGVHQDILGLPVAYGKRLLAEALFRVLVPLCDANYGRAARRCLPAVTLSPTEAQDQADLWTAAGGLKKSTYLDGVEDLSALDAKLGIPVERVQTASEAADAAAARAPAPVVSPAGGDSADPANPAEPTPPEKPAAKP
jgi:hypothetical protein